MGLWELIYTENTLINVTYLIVGYVGSIVCEFNNETVVHNVFMVFFWCGCWALFQQTKWWCSTVGALVAFAILKISGG